MNHTEIILKTAPVFKWQPRPWQQTVLDQQKKTTILLCSRRAGKTALCSFLASSALISSKEKISICAASFSLKNAREVLWAQIIEMLQPFPSNIRHIKSSDTILNEETGSIISLFGLSAEHGDGIRGRSFNLSVLDEFSRIPYSIFQNAYRPTLLDSNGWEVLITTPKGSFDLIHVLKQESEDSPEDHTFAVYPASQLIGQVPYLTQEFLDRQKALDPTSYQLEFEADISASADDTIFDSAVLSQALTTNPPTISHSLASHAGLDFAPRRDKSILAIRNSRNFIALIELQYNQDPHEFVRQITRFVDQYKIRSLTIDRGGAGEILSDLLEDTLSDHWPIEDVRGVIAGERPYHSSNFNLRSELFAQLRDFLYQTPNAISTSLAGHRIFLNELSGITRKANDSGKFQVVSRATIIQKIGRSPDYASAASLSFFFERHNEGWSKPPEELDQSDLANMTTAQIIDKFQGFYPNNPTSPTSPTNPNDQPLQRADYFNG